MRAGDRVGASSPFTRAERALSTVVRTLKSWSARERITLRRGEVLQVAEWAETARQELLACEGEPRRAPIAADVRDAVLRRDRWTCQSCQRDLRDAPDEIELDHIIPVARFGASTADNLRTLCRRCNRRKGAAA